MTMLWQNVILETCASNLFFAKFFSPLLSQQCEPETPSRQSCCVVRKRWWFRNFPPPYSLIYFQNPTDSSFIKRNDFSPLDSSSHQGIEQSVWILMLLYWHTLCYFIYNNRYWCSFFCMGFWYTSILISLYRIPPRENKRSYHFVTKQRKNTIYSFLPRIKAQNALHQQRHIHGCVSDENRNDNRLLSTVIRYVQELRWSCF